MEDTRERLANAKDLLIVGSEQLEKYAQSGTVVRLGFFMTSQAGESITGNATAVGLVHTSPASVKK